MTPALPLPLIGPSVRLPIVCVAVAVGSGFPVEDATTSSRLEKVLDHEITAMRSHGGRHWTSATEAGFVLADVRLLT